MFYRGPAEWSYKQWYKGHYIKSQIHSDLHMIFPLYNIEIEWVFFPWDRPSAPHVLGKALPLLPIRHGCHASPASYMQCPLVLAVGRQWWWHKCHCQHLHRPSCHPKYQGHYSTLYGKSQATESSFKEGAYALAAIWNLHWHLLGGPAKHRGTDLDRVVIGFGRKSLTCQTLSVNRFHQCLDRFKVFIFAWIPQCSICMIFLYLCLSLKELLQLE